MKNVIFPDEAITCDCGFKGDLKKMEKHFINTWTFTDHAIVKNGHKRVLN